MQGDQKTCSVAEFPVEFLGSKCLYVYASGVPVVLLDLGCLNVPIGGKWCMGTGNCLQGHYVYISS